MKQNTCDHCVYYRQHYTFDQRKIFRVYCGHCTKHRARTKRPDAQACEHDVQRDDGEEAFVSKEYLSKALLEYMLKLELLPVIYDGESRSFDENDCVMK